MDAQFSVPCDNSQHSLTGWWITPQIQVVDETKRKRAREEAAAPFQIKKTCQRSPDECLLAEIQMKLGFASQPPSADDAPHRKFAFEAVRID